MFFGLPGGQKFIKNQKKLVKDRVSDHKPTKAPKGKRKTPLGHPDPTPAAPKSAKIPVRILAPAAGGYIKLRLIYTLSFASFRQLQSLPRKGEDAFRNPPKSRRIVWPGVRVGILSFA